MCVGVESYNAVVTFASLTVVPDALSCIAIKYLPPNEIPPLSCRGIFVSVLSIGYLFYKGEWICIPACLYGIALQGISIYNLAKKIIPELQNYIWVEKEIENTLNSIKEGMDQLNLRSIGVKSFRQRYKRLLDRYTHFTPEIAHDLLQSLQLLHREFWQFYSDKLYLNLPNLET